MRGGSIITSRVRGVLRDSRRIHFMPLRALATEPQRPAMLGEARRRGRVILCARQTQPLFTLLRAQSRQDALRRERRFAQANADRIVDCVRDGRYGGGQRALTRFFRAEGREFRALAAPPVTTEET